MRSSLKPNRLHSYRHAGRPAVKYVVGSPGDVQLSPPPPDPWDFAQFLQPGFFGNFTELSPVEKSGFLH